jgi:hypothetical protein
MTAFLTFAAGLIAFCIGYYAESLAGALVIGIAVGILVLAWRWA